MEETTVVNIVLIGMLAIGAITGAFKGFARQMIELVGLVVSFFVAAVISSWLATMLSRVIAIAHAPALVLGFLLVFVGGLIAFHFVAISAQRMIHTSFFGWIDRVGGAVVGLLATILLASVLATVVIELPISGQTRASLDRSSVFTTVQPVAGWLFDSVFPRERGHVAIAPGPRSTDCV